VQRRCRNQKLKIEGKPQKRLQNVSADDKRPFKLLLINVVLHRQKAKPQQDLKRALHQLLDILIFFFADSVTTFKKETRTADLLLMAAEYTPSFLWTSLGTGHWVCYSSPHPL